MAATDTTFERNPSQDEIAKLPQGGEFRGRERKYLLRAVRLLGYDRRGVDVVLLR